MKHIAVITISLFVLLILRDLNQLLTSLPVNSFLWKHQLLIWSDHDIHGWLAYATITTSNEKNWHLFDDTLVNELYDGTNSSIATSIRAVWNIPGEDEAKKAYQELYFNYAIDFIYRHQHPNDCAKAKYLVSSGYNKGYIHDIHVEGYGLAVALEMNRIYIPNRKKSQAYSYDRQRNFYECTDFYSIDCYYELWSHCSWKDVDKILSHQRNIIRMIHPNEEQNEEYLKTGHLSESLIERYRNEKVIGINIHDKELPYRRIIPKQFSFITDRDVISKDRRYYWWRAISASYLLRPNIYMQELLRIYHMPTVLELQGRCVGKQ
jgi:hypothetical protein